MGLFDDRSDKTEAPTAKRRSDARSKGRVALSKELSTAVLMMTSVLMLEAAGPWMGTTLEEVMTAGLTLRRPTEISVPWATSVLQEFVEMVLPLMAVFAGVLFVVASGVGVLQAGWQVSLHPLTPNFGKLNPLSGLQRIFSTKGLVRALVALAKFALLALTLWFNLGDQLPVILELQNMPIEVAVPIVADLALEILWWISLPLLLIGVIDLLYQRFDHTRSLRMSKQEVKDESKNEEGDPEIKARIRRAQRELSTRRMMDEVPKADVVVTNPTHFAVALRYERGSMQAPKVVAKGVDEVALRIRSIAEEHRVPIWEDPPLARSLFAACDLDDEIPTALYQAVATVLAQVLRLKEGVSHA